MPVPPKLLRRLVIAPVVVLAESAAIVAGPALLVLAAVASLFSRGLRPVRFVMILLACAIHHLGAILGLFGLWLASGFGHTAGTERMQRAHFALMRWFVGGIYDAVVQLAHVTVRLEIDARTRAMLLARERPVIVLGRHAGEGDTLLVIRDLLVTYDRGPRIVLHEALRLDPVLDVLGDRLPSRFVDPRGGDTEVEIAAMAADLDPRGALVIFPEGVNFSEEARQRSIERLERGGYERQAAVARDIRHLSAPRPGGTLAAIRAADAEVVVMGHAGFPVGAKETWKLLPHPQVIDVCVWHVDPATIPEDEAHQIDWLFDLWRSLDHWIEERVRSGHVPQHPPAPQLRP